MTWSSLQFPFSIHSRVSRLITTARRRLPHTVLPRIDEHATPNAHPRDDRAAHHGRISRSFRPSIRAAGRRPISRDGVHHYLVQGAVPAAQRFRDAAGGPSHTYPAGNTLSILPPDGLARAIPTRLRYPSFVENRSLVPHRERLIATVANHGTQSLRAAVRRAATALD